MLAALLNALQADRQARSSDLHVAGRRPRRGRRRRDEDPARGRRDARDRLRLARRGAHRARRLPRRLDERRSSAGTRSTTNPERRDGGPADVIEGADLFVGLSGARVMPPEALARMSRDAMVFAMANPTPEVTPEEAAPYARIMATGRSDYPNQINNVLALPGHLPRRARRPRAADHRGDEARRRARDRGDRRARTSCARTTSSRRCSTATSRPPWPPRWPRRRGGPASRPPASRSASPRRTPAAFTRSTAPPRPLPRASSFCGSG